MSKKDSMSSKNSGYINRKYFVCLDTNIVISMAGLHTKNQHEIETLRLNGKFDSIKAFKTAVEKRQITAVITPYVLQELCDGALLWGYDTLNYLQKSNIKILDIPENKLHAYFTEIEQIATLYSTKLNRYTLSDIAHAQGRKPSDYATRVFSMQKDKQTGQSVPRNDARIMAEASKLGLMLVTNNTIDFIYGHRPELIGRINRKLNLPSRAIPLTSPEVLKMYNASQPFPKIKDTIGKIISAKDAKLDLSSEQ